MPYKANALKWYLAEIIEQVEIEGQAEKRAFINMTLVQATNPEEAYTKTLKLGNEEFTGTFENEDGQTVTSTFLGIKDITFIPEKLEHGTVIAFEPLVDYTQAEIEALIANKEQLNIFYGE